MTCPVCKRELAPTLSICLTCGAMMNDTVREELQTKIGTTPQIARVNALPKPSVKRAEPPPVAEPKVVAPPPAPVKFQTAELANKKTSPTLVGFQPKSATLPDWRLRLQNSIRQRRTDGSEIAVGEAVFQKQLVTNGANALKAQFVEEAEPTMHKNPKVANALERIEKSRRAFLPEKKTPPASGKNAARNKNYPFDVVAPSGDIDPNRRKKASVNPSPKPILVSSLRIEKKGYDTNKLPQLLQALEDRPRIPAKIERSVSDSLKFSAEAVPKPSEEIESAVEPIVDDVEIQLPDEIDDLAPLSSRLTAGLFDMIIGAFATTILLSPILVYGGSLMSIPAVLGVLAVFGVVMFVYLTLTVGFRGRTFGMRLFSLEVIDADINEYPTLHQAAVSSAVFLLALPLPGVGFLPALFNEEKRAAHDILSNTLVIREI